MTQPSIPAPPLAVVSAVPTDTLLDAHVEEFAAQLLDERLHSACIHDEAWAQRRLREVERLGKEEKLRPEELRLARAAVWLHTVGFLDSHHHPGESGAKLAQTLFTQRPQPDAVRQRLVALLRAADTPEVVPTDPLAALFLDALHGQRAKRRYLDRLEVRRNELSLAHGETVSEWDWLHRELHALRTLVFHTPAARRRYATRLAENTQGLERRLREFHNRVVEETKARLEKPSGRLEKGIDTVFRTASRNKLEMIAIADHKANMLLSVNSLLLTLVMSLLLSRIESHPWLAAPTVVLCVTSLTTLVLAALATRPSPGGSDTKPEDLEHKRVSPLYYGNVSHLTAEEFENSMRSLMRDEDFLYGSLIKDIYWYAKLVHRKYMLLRTAYTLFLVGMCVSVLSFGVAYLVGH